MPLVTTYSLQPCVMRQEKAHSASDADAADAANAADAACVNGAANDAAEPESWLSAFKVKVKAFSELHACASIMFKSKWQSGMQYSS